MQQKIHPITKDLVLIGGGHSHALVLRMLGMNPLPGLRITLISDTSHTPYSGMLPGHVAGFYNFDQTHIDLRNLAQFAQVQFYLDQAIGLDLAKNQVICADHPPVSFDYLSLDIGSTPATISVSGATEYAIPAKPVPRFLHRWNQLLEEVVQNPSKLIKISIVGGGAGGVELALNMHSHLHRLLKQAKVPGENLQINLFHSGAKLLPSHNPWVSKRLTKILLSRGIKLNLNSRVGEVLADRIICESGLNIPSDYTFWVTQASAPDWLKASGLTTDSQGFVLVKDTLQSVSHPHIFAAGDIATMENYQRPKAGVFAVRQGKPLYNNLCHIFLGEELENYVPQKRYLGLIGTGDQQAIASWGNFGWQSPWLWRWKDKIDRKFMDLFAKLPAMEIKEQKNVKADASPSPMYCAGCGAKVGSNTLKKVLQRLEVQENPDVVMGMQTPDDAAVVRVPTGKLMIHTLDYFPALVSDPYIFGQIATNHCLSDIFAMGAIPQTALAMATISHGTPAKVEETLFQLLSGAMKILAESNTTLVGGHTTEGEELVFGLACNGVVQPEKLLPKSGMEPGQVLILTKALGTGTLFAAKMHNQVKGRWLDGAIESMLLSNQSAARIFLEQEATALTDVTGFGLLGHLLEMVETSRVRVRLNLETIPVLAGALHTLGTGYTSSLHPHNALSSHYEVNISEVNKSAKYQLLFDPQTSGGLLGAVPAEKASNCLRALRAAGYGQSEIIGEVLPGGGDKAVEIH